MQIRCMATAGVLALAMAACGTPAESEAEAEASGEEVVVEEVTNEAAGDDEVYEVCDGEGNRYPSEQAAVDAGLSEAEYGATYCDYIDAE